MNAGVPAAVGVDQRGEPAPAGAARWPSQLVAETGWPGDTPRGRHHGSAARASPRPSVEEALERLVHPALVVDRERDEPLILDLGEG